jgi:EAL domain-containing protein (putative c-di-GMP-specific phosphodiesterase class I)
MVEAATRRVLGVEALLRWHDERLGWVPPTEFVAVAEESGLMVRLGDWVLLQACRQLRAWHDAGLTPLRMAVNVSRCQLRRGNLPARVREALAETGIPPAMLELEISERGALRDEPIILAQLRELKRMGVRLLVDDFGTGQSAIAYLKQFPLDGLKIDRSFVDGIAEGGDDAAIASAIVAMAHRLRLSVVAEGVEQPAQLSRLQEFGCEGVQGFLFSEAVPAQRVPSLIAADDGPPRSSFREEAS